jgi:hypothetical protein
MENGKTNGKSNGKEDQSAKVAEISAKLAPFRENNPVSQIADIGGDVAVIMPWGDESLAIKIPSPPDELIEALNNVYLPERFTAIWHRDSGEFEIIYSLVSPSSDLRKRLFSFRHRGRDYTCRFGPASSRLLSIADNHHTIAASHTHQRNLGIFQLYFLSKRLERIRKESEPDSEIDVAPELTVMTDAEPTSFWIKGIEWNEDAVLDLVRHLNFFMYYYDTGSPQILIHPAKSESVSTQPRTRYPFGPFPKTIVSRELDDALLLFWGASISGDPVRRFLYNYQILEFAAFSFIEENIKREIRRSLAEPDAIDKLETLTDYVIEVTGESKMAEIDKLYLLLRTAVRPHLVWEAIKDHLAQFSQPWKFDGGLEIQPLTREKWTADDFKTSWVPNFANAFRSIRNALSHGREPRMTGVITPTTANFAKLQIWLSPLSVAAQEIILHRKLV